MLILLLLFLSLLPGSKPVGHKGTYFQVTMHKVALFYCTPGKIIRISPAAPCLQVASLPLRYGWGCGAPLFLAFGSEPHWISSAFPFPLAATPSPACPTNKPGLLHWVSRGRSRRACRWTEQMCLTCFALSFRLLSSS